MTSRLIDRPLTNGAYGFPTRGHARRIPPVILAVAHITGNSRTAAYADQLAAAVAERDYANRAGSGGPSAHLYVGRDGRGVRAIDWTRFAAWSNGDVNNPDRTNTRIVRALSLRASGYNFNETCGIEAELVGYGGTLPVLSAQLDTFAEEIARASKVFGLPIDRTTIIGHYQVNSVDRANCPSAPARHEAVLGELVARARTWYATLFPAPAPAPAPEVYPMIEVTDKARTVVRVRPGATLLDLNGKAAVTVSNDADRDSPGATADGRLVFAYWSGSTKLVLARTADVVSVSSVPDQAAAVADLSSRLATVAAELPAISAATSAINGSAAKISAAIPSK